eukprot:9438807-Pyramimonas_sp.AAC.1
MIDHGPQGGVLTSSHGRLSSSMYLALWWPRGLLRSKSSCSPSRPNSKPFCSQVWSRSESTGARASTAVRRPKAERARAAPNKAALKLCVADLMARRWCPLRSRLSPRLQRTRSPRTSSTPSS